MKKRSLIVSYVVLTSVFICPSLAQKGPSAVYSQNPEANALFLKAREYSGKSDPRTGGKLANAREAIKLFEQAVQKDPSFALAYVELSRAWLSLGYSDPDGATNEEILPPARAAAVKAVELDPKLPEAHLGLASLSTMLISTGTGPNANTNSRFNCSRTTLGPMPVTPLI